MNLLNKYKDKISHFDIYIGRGTPVGNPYVIGKHAERDECIDIYDPYLLSQIVNENPQIMKFFKDLKDEDNLYCFCKPKRCHGDIIIKYYEELKILGLEKFKEKYQSTLGHPLTDGIDHINIYSKGKTELGHLLSNFSFSPFKHPEYGKFVSIEGFWHWLSTGQKEDKLRELYGYQAKELGKNLQTVEVKDFYFQITKALRYKINQDKHLRKLLYESVLPFKHYYTYGNENNCKIITTMGGFWLAYQFEKIRQEEKNKGYSLIIAGSRDISDYDLVKKFYLDSGFKPSEIVSGRCRGVDILGERISREILGKEPVMFPADWKGKGKGAGYIRNGEMGDYAHGLLAIQKNNSNGTQDMIDKAIKLGLDVKVYKV